MQSYKKQQGFTLIELLIALSISAVIAIASYQSIESMVNVKTSVSEHSEKIEKIQRVLWWMEQDIIQMAPRPIADELGSPQPALKYRSDTGIEFTRIAQFPAQNAQHGMLRVGYELNSGTLYRITWPVLDRAPDTQPLKTSILKNVNSFELALLDNNQQWNQAWPNQDSAINVLPRAVRITIEHEEYGKISRLFMGVG